MAQQNLTQELDVCTKWFPFRCQIQLNHHPATLECELESGVPVRPLPAGAGGRAHRGLLGRDVGRHVQALLEGERRLDLLMRKFDVLIHVHEGASKYHTSKSRGKGEGKVQSEHSLRAQAQ